MTILDSNEKVTIFKSEHSLRIILGILILFIGFHVCKTFYNVYLHPLASYPGPWLRAASDLPWTLDNLNGVKEFSIRKLHAEYGNVVRLAPDQLSFASIEGRQDIYGLRMGHRNLPKDSRLYHMPPHGAHSITTSPNNAHHARYRRALNHAFSEKAMREQEPLLTRYVDGLIEGLRNRASMGPLDMMSWFNFTTFDIIGDLSFGESFGSVETGEYHPWISNVFGSVKAGAILMSLKTYPTIYSVFMPIMKWLPSMKERAAHYYYTTDKLDRRLSAETDRADFITYILRHRGKETELNWAEMQATAASLVIAGSETTATLLTFNIYELCKNPDVLKKLTAEIRSEFAQEDEIDMISVGQLQYQGAVLEETLRLHPPAPFGPPRVVTDGGDTIDGNWVPGGTRVSTPILTMSRHPEYFTNPDNFVPERWLKDGRYEKDNLSASKPFSIGPRDCIGKNLAYAEMRLILARLLWNFDIEPTEQSASWLDGLLTYTLWMKHPLMVNLRPVEASA